ncbi:MAG: glycosyltransferase family 2 protein [Deltaproteobacteria bacterium]|nr:glycosyltransferase family 2 protein [Deltaproteobacteria bacterium]
MIVPTYQSAGVIEPCLRSIRAQTHPKVELVVVDNGSQDATKEIAGRYADQVLDKGPERCAQRNFGVEKARGEIVVIIDSDMILTPGVVGACVDVLSSEPHVEAVVIPEESFGEGFWSRCKALERSFYVGVDWMEGARAFRRDTYLAMGGYDEAFVGGEDYDLPQRIEERFGARAIARVAPVIRHDEQRLSLTKTCKKKFYYAQNLDKYREKPANQGRFARQASPLRRYELFLSQPNRLLEDPVTSAGMLVLKTCEFAAGALGYAYGRARSR